MTTRETASMTERWKDVPGYEGYYQVSDQGRVRSLPRVVHRRNGSRQRIPGRLLQLRLSACGHPRVALCCCGRRRDRPIHQLVLEAFVGLCPVNMEGCHNNGIHTDNRLLNLRWDTHKSNMEDTGRHGVRPTLPVRRSDGRTYRSCKAAAKAVGVHRSSVSRSIYLGQHCAGYAWEFIKP